MATRIKNKGAYVAPLPFPFREVLGPGESVVVYGTPDQVLAAFNDQASAGRMFAFVEVPDSELPTISEASAVWDDLRVPLTAAAVPTAAYPTFGNIGIGTIQGYLFDPDATNSLGITAQVPHDYIPGTAWRPHIHWKTTDGNGGVVRWQLEYVIASQLSDYAGSSTTLTLDANVTPIGAARHRVDSFSAISGTGLDISATLIGRIARVGGAAEDTYAANVVGIEVDFHYQKRRFGTEVEFPTS